MRVLSLPLAFVLAVILGASPVLAHVLPRPDRPRPTIFVRVVAEPNVQLDRAVLSAAIDWSHDIWRPFADVTFGTADDLRASTSMLTLTVTLTERAATFDAADSASSLGWIEFTDNRPSTALTVSVGTARQLVTATKWQGQVVASLPRFVVNEFLSRALGRAIAHEVGHFLLGSKQHTRAGLMRAQFTGAELVRADHGLDTLGADEIARLRGRATERAEAAAPPSSGSRPIS